MNIVTDTNVWYRIAAGQINPGDIKRGGENQLCATPINILELISNVSDAQFSNRQNAIRSIIQHSDTILDDPETHLTHIWGFTNTQDLVLWDDILTAVNNATDLNNLTNGVLDFAQRVTRRVNVNFAHFWRTNQWSDFRNQIENTIDEIILPGYLEARRNGEAIYLDQIQGQDTRNILFSPEIQENTIIALYDRAIIALQDMGVILTPEQLILPTGESRVNSVFCLQPYIQAYSQYLFRCSTSYTPQNNDWGDLESFLYLQGENRLLTYDNRWIEIARDTGNEDFLFII